MELAEQLRQGELKLPLPPALNSVYRSTYQNGSLRTYKSKEAKDYAEELGWRLKGIKPEKGAVSLELLFAFRRDRDIDSGLKVLLDCLSGYVYEDDKQVTELIVRKELIPRSGTVEPFVLVCYKYLECTPNDVPF